MRDIAVIYWAEKILGMIHFATRERRNLLRFFINVIKISSLTGLMQSFLKNWENIIFNDTYPERTKKCITFTWETCLCDLRCFFLKVLYWRSPRNFLWNLGIYSQINDFDYKFLFSPLHFESNNMPKMF